MVYNFTYLLIMTIRKRAGAIEPNVTGGSGAAVGMISSMKECVKEALAGRTGETDDEDD